MLSNYQARKHALMVRSDALLSSDPRAMRIEVPARKWNHARHETDVNAIVLGSNDEIWHGSNEVIMINPNERRWHGGRKAPRAFVLWFGGCGATYLHCFADGLEDALERCAAWLVDFAPGHIMGLGSDEHTDLCKEAFEDAGLTWTGEIDWSDAKQSDAIQSAEADFTSTESGYLTSYEWGISLECPSTEALYAFVCNE